MARSTENSKRLSASKVVRTLSIEQTCQSRLEDQGRPDPGAASGDAVTPRVGAEDGELFGKPTERLNQRVEPAAGQQLIEATETKHDALLDLAVHPLVIHDEQISPGTVGLRANEQIALLCHYHGSM